ncbi:MAG: outer membrane beta-barrel protein [Kiritimatiellae bacterium]|nr:outer membrane beta-barrel protein [Kiritimatiellia bacterium]MDD5520878.1 outer membrane beta-barrel protein [Kiritimatiellia bacterium]
MKTNRQILTYTLAGIMIFGVVCAGAEEKSFDLVTGYHWLSPKKDMDWKDASGIEMQLRFWQSEHLGFGVVAAYDTWKARTEITEEEGVDSYFYTSVFGDASVTSLGASLLYRSESSASVKLLLDIGLRYALVDSSVYGEAAYDGPGGPNYFNEKIDIDDTVLFVVGAGVEFEVTKDIALILGLGYQIDLKKPEETFAGESLGETGLDAVKYGLSLTCKF